MAAAAPVPLDEVIKLFTSRHAFDLSERHVAALARVAAANASGMAVAELAQLQRLLAYAKHWIEQGSYACAHACARAPSCAVRPRASGRGRGGGGSHSHAMRLVRGKQARPSMWYRCMDCSRLLASPFA